MQLIVDMDSLHEIISGVIVFLSILAFPALLICCLDWLFSSKKRKSKKE